MGIFEDMVSGSLADMLGDQSQNNYNTSATLANQSITNAIASLLQQGGSVGAGSANASAASISRPVYNPAREEDIQAIDEYNKMLDDKFLDPYDEGYQRNLEYYNHVAENLAKGNQLMSQNAAPEMAALGQGMSPIPGETGSLSLNYPGTTPPYSPPKIDYAKPPMGHWGQESIYQSQSQSKQAKTTIPKQPNPVVMPHVISPDPSGKGITGGLFDIGDPGKNEDSYKALRQTSLAPDGVRKSTDEYNLNMHDDYRTDVPHPYKTFKMRNSSGIGVVSQETLPMDSVIDYAIANLAKNYGNAPWDGQHPQGKKRFFSSAYLTDANGNVAVSYGIRADPSYFTAGTDANGNPIYKDMTWKWIFDYAEHVANQIESANPGLFSKTDPSSGISPDLKMYYPHSSDSLEKVQKRNLVGIIISKMLMGMNSTLNGQPVTLDWSD